MTGPERPPRSPRPGAGAGRYEPALAVVVAWNFGVAQPLLDVLGRSAPFFVAHEARPVDLVLLALGLTVVAPAALAGVLALVTRLHARAGRALHAVVVGVLLALFARQVVGRIGSIPGALAAGLVLALAGAAVSAWERAPAARSFVRWLAPAPLVFLGLFLFASPSGRLVFPSSAAAAEAARIGNPVPVVVVVFDELPSASLMTPDGAVDGSAYPNFARLARTSTWYRNTTTVDTFTPLAVPAVVDGRQPGRMVVPTVRDHPRNLFTLLAGVYDVDAYEAATMLCPPSECGEPGGRSWWERTGPMLTDVRAIAAHTLLPGPLARRFPSLEGRWAGFGDDDDAAAGSRRRDLASTDPTAATAAFAARLRPGARPGLHYLQLRFPHTPWRFLPGGQVYEKPRRHRSGWGSWPGRDAAEQGLSRHLLQVRYADRLLGSVLDRMKATGLLDRALVVVTADHGIGFDPRSGWRDADPRVVGDTAWVPLFVKRPGQARGAVDDRPASTVDIMPTVASVLRMPLPGVDGRSLTGPPWGDRERVVRAVDGELGPPIALPAGAGPRDAAVDRSWATYPTGSGDPHRLFRLGPYGPLVGRPVPAGVARDPGLRATLDDAGRFDDLDPAAPELPVLVSGTVTAAGGAAPPREGARLVVAVDGVVAGTSWVRDVSGGRGAFTALLDPSAFQRGRNAVAVYAATGPASRPVLRLLPAP